MSLRTVKPFIFGFSLLRRTENPVLQSSIEGPRKETKSNHLIMRTSNMSTAKPLYFLVCPHNRMGCAEILKQASIL